MAHRLGELWSQHRNALSQYMLTPFTAAETIIDFDRVLVLRGGKVVEFDAPAALLDKRDGAFREMVEATGNFNELKRKAQKGKAKGGSGSKGACS